MKIVSLWIACLAIASSCSRRDQVTDWTAVALTEVKDTIDDVAFSLTVPHGLAVTRDAGTVTFSAGNTPGTPHVRVTLQEIAPPRTTREAVERATSETSPGRSAMVVLRKDSIRRGQLVVHHSEDKASVVATTFRALRDGRGKEIAGRTLVCTASVDQVGDATARQGQAQDSEARFSVLTSWLANICLTLSPEDLQARGP